MISMLWRCEGDDDVVAVSASVAAQFVPLRRRKRRARCEARRLAYRQTTQGPTYLVQERDGVGSQRLDQVKFEIFGW